jgi:flagellar protein FlbT
MALRVELKPGERVIVGESVITAAEGRTILLIEGDAPILREKDVIGSADATTPARRIYFAVQCMYLNKSVARFKDEYFALVDELVRAAPSFLGIVDAINNLILTGNLYKALKEAKLLLLHEEELLRHV